MKPVEGASRSSTRTTHGSHQADSPWSTLWTDGISTRTTYLAIMDSTSRILNGDADWRTDSDGVRRTRSVGKDNRRNLSDHNFAPSVWLISPPPPAHGPPLLVAQPNFHSVGRHFMVPLLYPTSPTHALFTPRFSMSRTNSSHMTSDSMPLARICMLVQLLVFIAPASDVADVLDLWPRLGEQEPRYQLHAMLILVRLFDT